MLPEITVQELKSMQDANEEFLLLDVRNEDEYSLCHLNALLIPFAELPQRLSELDKNQHIVIYCHGGGRSSRATKYLIENGFPHVSNLKGGITAWATEIDPSMPKY